MRGRLINQTDRPLQRGTCCPGSAMPDRRAFSLPELLIVLAILTAMIAFALPAMRGPLDKSRLRSSAITVKSALAKARSSAIREGCDAYFHYELGGNKWRVECAGRAHSQTSTKNGTLNPTESPLNNPETANRQPVIREGRLPEGCTFVEDVTNIAMPEEVTSTPSELVEAEMPSSIRWAAPVVFRPNGRSNDSRIRVIGTRDFAIRIQLRGLTGAVSWTAPYRVESVDTPLNAVEVTD